MSFKIDVTDEKQPKLGKKEARNPLTVSPYCPAQVFPCWFQAVKAPYGVSLRLNLTQQLTTPIPGPMHTKRDSKEYPCQNISKLAARCTILVRWGAIVLHRSFHADSRLSRHRLRSVRTCSTYIWSNAVTMASKDNSSKSVSQQLSLAGRTILVRWGHFCSAQVFPCWFQAVKAPYGVSLNLTHQNVWSNEGGQGHERQS